MFSTDLQILYGHYVLCIKELPAAVGNEADESCESEPKRFRELLKSEPELLPFTAEPQVMPEVSPAGEDVNLVSVTAPPAETVIGAIPREGRTVQSHQLSADLPSTPEVQRVIVEHIVKNSEYVGYIKREGKNPLYVNMLKRHLEESYQVAIKNSRKVADKNKRRFDKVIRESTLDVGDRVLVRNVRLRNKHKLADRWEPTTYVVTKRMGDLPVYTLKPEKGDGPLRTLHRDLLIPCGFLLQMEDEEPERTSKPRRPKTRQSVVQPEDNNGVQQDDDDDEICYWFEPSQEMRETYVIKMYDSSTPNSDKHQEEPGKLERDPCMDHSCSGPLEQEEPLSPENHLLETPTGALPLLGTSAPERPNNKESSQHLILPAKEKETKSHLPEVVHENPTDGDSESLSSDESVFKMGDSNSNAPPSTPGNTQADASDIPGTSSIQTTRSGDQNGVIGHHEDSIILNWGIL
ncbi:hypothetical protein L3Q82_005285 [Scortum barcoo]|uniref:Uncharacterized protein n=1 Tax=Scortum barcoo TaxID=214431 RepID=A0ACB8V9Z3_9TELE|nr:hypothetical protein L3Q82_005285 [Scortum barcoo]